MNTPHNGATRRVTVPRATKFLDGVAVGDRQVRVIASDATPDRMGDILEASGARLANFRRNPIVLAQHRDDQPIGTASVALDGDKIVALIEFPPAGVSVLSDQYLALMKAGVLSAVSVGFLPIERVPLDSGGYRYTVWELLEISCVSVPANPAALVTERSFRSDPGTESRMRRAAALRRRLDAPADPGAEDRRRRAAEMGRRLDAPATYTKAADPDPDPDADVQVLTKLAALRAEHQEKMQRRDRAAAIDAALRALQW
jgi:HK97 family phage prohead protease